jgi:hypothetical protein
VSPRHAELASVLSVPPNVFDDFAVNGTANTTLHHLMLSRHRAEIETERASSGERLAAVEADRAGIASANEKRADEVRALSVNLEALRVDLDRQRRVTIEQTGALEALRVDLERQQRVTIEQTEALARAAMTLEAAGAAHTASIVSLEDRHRVELDARLQRERELEGRIERAALATEIAQREAARRESVLAEHLARSERELRDLRQERDALLLGMRARESAIHQQLDEAAAQMRSLRDEHDAQMRALRDEHDAHLRDMALLRRQFARSERKGSALLAELNSARASWSWRLQHWRTARRPLPEGDDDADADATGEAPAGAALPYDAAPTAPAPVLISPPVPATEVTSMSTNSIDPYVRAGTVQELLLLHDVVFVNSAYWAVLGRQPDQSGRADYLAQVRAGTAKEEILVALARSDEGRRVAAPLSGLDKVIAAFEASRFSLPQRIVRRLFKGTSADLERNFRRLENLMVRHANALTSRLDSMELQLLKLSDEATAGQRGTDAGRAAGHAAASSLPPDRASVRTDDETPLGLQALTEQERFVLRKIAKL